MTGDQEFQLLSALVPSVAILILAVAAYLRSRNIENKLDSNTATTEQTRDKLDQNTVLAQGSVDKLSRIDRQTNGDLDKIKDEVHRMSEEIRTIQVDLAKGQEIAQREIVSTRHEMRGHLGTLTNALNSLFLVQGLAPIKPAHPADETKGGE